MANKALSILLLSLLYLTVSSVEILQAPHECKHGGLDIHIETIDTGSPEENNNQRTLITWESIRIILDFSTMSTSASTLATRSYLETQVLPPVYNLLSSALKVQRLTSNLVAGGATTMCSGAVVTPAIYNSGGVAADLVIFVVDTTDSSSSYIAQAGACSISSTNNRPIFGLLRYNLYYVSSSTNDVTIESHIYTTLHEITHVLGFSSGLYGYFINPTTNALLTGHVTTKTVNGASVTVLNLAPLTTRIRSHFNCPTIEGAYIENEGGSGSAGSHFERRIFYNDYMTASIIKDMRFSQFSLALLEGSGWYMPDYTYAEATTWGKNKGCDFFNTPCVNSVTKLASFEEFCSPLTSKGISWTGRGYGPCVGDALSTWSSLPSYRNYWGNNTVNNDAFADNCPIRYEYSNMDCEDTTRYNLLSAHEFTGYGGKGFTGTLYPGGTLSTPYGYCFKTNCVASGSGYQLQVLFGTSYIATCTAAGQINPPTGTGLGGKLYCPDPTKFCNQILTEGNCKGSCFGRGSCINRQCVCQDGWTFHDCIKKQYVPNCARCASNPSKKTCYGDQCVCDPSDTACTSSAGATFIDIVAPGDNSFTDNTEAGYLEDGHTGASENVSLFSILAFFLGAVVIITGLRAGFKAGSSFKTVPTSDKPSVKAHHIPNEEVRIEADPEVQITN
jgi:hypothetical protein